MIALASIVLAAQLTHGDFVADFQTLWSEVKNGYAYFDAKATRWDEVPQLYRADLDQVKTKTQFIALLEKVLDELYDAHTQLTVNTPSSPRLVPSGTDLWAEWIDGKATVTEVRRDSTAWRAGIRPGLVTTSVDDVPIAEAVDRRIGRAVAHDNPAARGWALRAVLAGTHDKARKINNVILSAEEREGSGRGRVTSSILGGNIGYINFNDSLGDQETIKDFDAALAALKDTKGLILDLRDTPSGGNSSVARGILSRFVDREMPYQKHELVEEEREIGVRRSWLELVSPRGPFRYSAPVVVLVDHWTGSMGEGIAIGFDAIGRATIVGTPMAGLNGATYHIQLPHTGIGVNVPAEKLFHVNGTPREKFVPPVVVDVNSETAADPFLQRGLAILLLR
ncbi:MAG TPA: S41 family peptidase [Thermoanaerobaculia bacterium]|nr:S41 family peptidase [Thermoanaerobaculia bacterium]